MRLAQRVLFSNTAIFSVFINAQWQVLILVRSEADFKVKN